MKKKTIAACLILVGAVVSALWHHANRPTPYTVSTILAVPSTNRIEVVVATRIVSRALSEHVTLEYSADGSSYVPFEYVSGHSEMPGFFPQSQVVQESGTVWIRALKGAQHQPESNGEVTLTFLDVRH